MRTENVKVKRRISKREGGVKHGKKEVQEIVRQIL
jgi:hypothetical protein